MNNSNNLTKAFYEELTYPGPGTNISTLWANRIKKFVTHENFTFLDAGCGTCKTLAGILKIHEKSTGIGIDLSENSLILGEKLLKYHNLFDRSKLLKKSFNEPFKLENKFDFIIAGGSIHHSLNFKNSFKFLSDNLKSGGYFCGMVYSKRGHEYRYRLKEMLYLFSKDTETQKKIYLNLKKGLLDYTLREIIDKFKDSYNKLKFSIRNEKSKLGYRHYGKITDDVFFKDEFQVPVDYGLDTLDFKEICKENNLEPIILAGYEKLNFIKFNDYMKEKLNKLNFWERVRLNELYDPIPKSINFILRKI